MTAVVTKLIDNNKRLLIRLLGDAAEGRTLKIDAGGLTHAMNLNNMPLGVLTDRKPQYQLYLKKVDYDIQSNSAAQGYVELSGDGAVPNTIIYLSGTDSKNFNMEGDGYVIPTANTLDATCNGNVFLRTVGFGAGAAYCIFLDFKKEPQHFAAGQFQDPTAFNRGPALGPG